MKAALASAPSKSVVLLQACSHNPTGVDPSFEQWKQLKPLLKSKQHVVMFDSAYHVTMIVRASPRATWSRT